jgi:UDP-N-acetylglucosamine 2-epimerase (non-hydrolysing)
MEPVGYAASLWLLRQSACVVSDSGGLQEEAPCFGTPVLVTRENTERPEGIAPGFLRIVGTDPVKLQSALQQALHGDGEKHRLRGLPNPFGDGKAAGRIAADVARLLAGGGH